MRIVIVLNERDVPAGKLADAELHFDSRDGLLDGLKLQGFAVWQARWPVKDSSHPDLRCTVPARAYQVNGEQRTWNLVRGVDGSNVRGVDDAALAPLRNAILDAYVDEIGDSLSVEAHRPVTALTPRQEAARTTSDDIDTRTGRPYQRPVELPTKPAAQSVARAQQQVRRAQPAARPTASDDYPF